MFDIDIFERPATALVSLVREGSSKNLVSNFSGTRPHYHWWAWSVARISIPTPNDQKRDADGRNSPVMSDFVSDRGLRNGSQPADVYPVDQWRVTSTKGAVHGGPSATSISGRSLGFKETRTRVAERVP